MGTRGLLGLIIQAQRRATYNHWDSYPDGLGQQIVKFILSLKPEDYVTMERNLRKITWVQEQSAPSVELQKHYSELGFSNLKVNSQGLDSWYCLLHKTQGAAALPEVLNGNLKHMIDSVEFLNDGLFCEWAYFIDFDKKILETWKAREHRKPEIRYSVEKVGEATFEELRENKGYMEGMQKID